MSEPQSHQPHRPVKARKSEKIEKGKNPKAFAYATPGRFAKQAARAHDVSILTHFNCTFLLTIGLDQRETLTCPACRSITRGSAPDHCRSGRTVWGWKNDADKVFDKTVYETNPNPSYWSFDSRDFQEEEIDLCRKPGRFIGEHD